MAGQGTARRGTMKKGNRHGFSEKQVMDAVQNAVRYDQSILLHRVNVGARKIGNRFIRFGEPGMSDFSGIIKEVHCPICRGLTGAGVRLEIECKAPDGRLTDAQKNWIDTINAMNGIAIVFQPKTVDELFDRNVQAFLKSQIYRHCANCAKTMLGTARLG